MAKRIHVAVAVIQKQQQVLISLRQAYQHQGGCWEFPGGKVECNESVFDALRREIREEVALDIHLASPLLSVQHDYGDRAVLLDVWLVERYSGQAQGKEGQQLRWCPIEDLQVSDFPEANRKIIERLQRERR